MRTLYGLQQSPWTEKARWALDHHTIAYRYHEHVPVLGEVFLRMKARSRPPGTKASVPLLADGGRAFCSSLEIARHAETIGRGDPLFPKESADVITKWADASDEIIGAGRVWVLAGLGESREAQREALPSFIPGPLRSVMTPVAKTASWFLGSKYDVPRSADSLAAEADKVRPVLDEVRAALKGKKYLAGDLSFADVAVASSLQALRPRARAPIGPATRAIWSNEALARDYSDLLEWRDAIYAKHRPGG